MDSEQFKSEIAKLLKAEGFKKSNATWRKSLHECIAVFNVQKSSWGGGVYYINLGIYFTSLGSETAPTENRCHIQERLEVSSPEIVVKEALNWFSSFETLELAKQRHESGSLKGKRLVMIEVIHAIST